MPGFEVFGDEERRAVLDLFDLNGGVLFAHGFDDVRKGVFKVREWESEFAGYFGFQHAQAVSSGSAAVKIALASIGVGPGDEVITQAHTYIATVEAIVQTGATPIIVDIDDTLNMDPNSFSASISPRTRAVIPVHMLGEMADMDPIALIAAGAGISVVEDCAQALGASYKGSWSGAFSEAAAFSTDAGKTLCTGEGGMVITQTNDHFVRARALHDHGHSYEIDTPRGQDPSLTSGFNYRMTELQAAIGIVQLSKLQLIISQQRKNKNQMMTLLRDQPLEFRRSVDPSGDLGDTIVMILPDAVTAQKFAKSLRDQRVGLKNLPDAMRWHFARYWNHLLRDVANGANDLENSWSVSAEILERCVALPINVNMTSEDTDRMASSVAQACRVTL
jgi:8-amino-3,8-dideoxy-alpha-D-manno-octulosonate transaminase